MRALRHLLTPHWVAMRAFPKSALRKIEQAIKQSEQQHDGELRFAVEAGLPWPFPNPRKRAETLFAQLGVWDTARNSGVIIYVQLIDRRIEIVADRGIAAKVEQNEWKAICRTMETAFKKEEFLDGSLQAITAITQILAQHFPPRARSPNELPDKPVVL